MNVIPVMYSTRSISYVIARTSNNDMNMKHVMYLTRVISYVIYIYSENK